MQDEDIMSVCFSSSFNVVRASVYYIILTTAYVYYNV